MLSWKRPSLGQTESGGYLWPQAPIPGIIPSEWGLAPAPETAPPPAPEAEPFPAPQPQPQPSPVYVINPPFGGAPVQQPYSYYSPLPQAYIPAPEAYYYAPLPEPPLPQAYIPAPEAYYPLPEPPPPPALHIEETSSLWWLAFLPAGAVALWAVFG